MSEPLLEISGLEKDYHTLRPLRVRQFTVRPGEVFSISGIDMLGAETFVHLVTGATLPDTGDVSLFGRNTRGITDGEVENTLVAPAVSAKPVMKLAAAGLKGADLLWDVTGATNVWNEPGATAAVPILDERWPAFARRVMFQFLTRAK